MKFAKGKQLGAGGQGAVYLGTYDSMPVFVLEVHLLQPAFPSDLKHKPPEREVDHTRSRCCGFATARIANSPSASHALF
eukprot:838874-Rhodomonas_salina.2